MKCLVLYASKKGTTEDCANMITNELKCDLINLKENNNPDVSDYDLIIIGTPLYMGKPLDMVLKFCNNSENVLKNKKIAFFMCGISPYEEMLGPFKKIIPTSLISNAITINHFGGEFRKNKCNFFEKTILENVIKEKKLSPKINKDEINVFISKIKEVL